MNDPRFLQEEGQGIFTGNELLVKGGLEGRLGLLTGYPGSPVSEVFDAAGRVADLLVERGILVQIANNEALGAARLNGSQMAPVRAMAVMKSVGAHVASDGLAIGNMAGTGPAGGVVAVFGDDTWSEGTQVPADSRFIAKHLYMPLLEPSTFQEVKDWIGAAFDLSDSTGLFVAYLVTSNQADGGGTVVLGPNRFPDLTTNNPVEIDSRTISTEDRVVIPPLTSIKEDEVLSRRLPAFLEAVRARGLNRILGDTPTARRPIGFVTSSLAYCYLEHALDMVGLAGRYPILKYGVTYPLDPEILRTFSERVDEIYVVEEKRGFLEEQVTAALQGLHQEGRVGPFRVWGKRFPNGWKGFPASRGLNPSIVLQTLAPVLLERSDPVATVDADRIGRELELIGATSDSGVEATVRTPSFCPGCPHRDSASVLNRIVDDFGDEDYMSRRHGHHPVDLVFHGDIGCYTLLKHKPFNRLMHNLSGMGLGGGTGAGIDRFITNKQIVFMGDSTFFHSGMAAVSDSIKHGQDITYVILDNKTTAMTGHQPTPGTDVDVMGSRTFAQDIERTVRGMAGSDGDTPVQVIRMDPEAREAYRSVLEEAILRDGVKVIVAEKECGITYHRRVKARQKEQVRERGYLAEETHINITPEACEYCLECTRATGCSGLTVEEELHGPKIATDLSLCVTDGACTRVRVAGDDKTCPCFEELTIRRKRPAEARTEEIDLTGLVEPMPDDFDGSWYAYVAGVGGMGINTISAILSVAGARQGYAVRFTNKKGLAIRNGAVYSHVNFAKGDR
ncbi:MAG: thiamine pyrophosphate-dependent enzyme, partial [Candidatus Latescibacteria bacterium]|nr:thiamine pyrophosphate-dependent enzyme [Candidatus Latescibacterota bacterium]